MLNVAQNSVFTFIPGLSYEKAALCNPHRNTRMRPLQFLNCYDGYITYTTFVSNYKNHVVLMSSLRNAKQYSHVTSSVASVVAHCTRMHGSRNINRVFSFLRAAAMFLFHFIQTVTTIQHSMALLQVGLLSIPLHKFNRLPCWYY